MIPARRPLVVDILSFFARRDLLVVDVRGRSMEPHLIAGDRLLCSRSAQRWRGAIVVRRVSRPNSTESYQVKRLLGLGGDQINGIRVPAGSCWLQGDNATASTDSRHFGPVPFDEVVGVAVARLRGSSLRDFRPPGPTNLGRFDRLREWWGDVRHRVETRTRSSAESFGMSPAMVKPYVPTPWSVIRRAFDSFPITKHDVLVDLGCGKGRVLVVACSYPFAEIIGVELIPQLAAVARRNLRTESRCSVVVSDAGSFALPDHATVLFLFNPFTPTVDARVGQLLRASLSRAPRSVRVLAYHVEPTWLARTPPVQVAPNLLQYVLEPTDSTAAKPQKRGT